MKSEATAPSAPRRHVRVGALLVSVAALAACLATGAAAALAGQVNLVWDTSADPALAGYKVHYGTVSRTYPSSADAKNATTYTVTGLAEGVTYYFAVTAYDAYGGESAYSNEVSHTVPGVADIALLGNGATIASGDTTPSGADYTDFGGTDVNGGTVTRTFTIRNPGSGALTLTGTPAVALGGANAADFAVTAAPAASVAAAGSTTFEIRFDPGASGTRTATVTVASSVAAKSPYTFTIQGAGTTAPDIALLGNGVTIASGDAAPSAADFTDFGATRLAGGVLSRTFTIQNQGSGALTLTGTPAVAIGGPGAPDFSVLLAPATTVAPGASTTFQVQCDPGAAGARTATLSLANSVPGKSPYTFAIQCTGVAAPSPPTNVRVVP